MMDTTRDADPNNSLVLKLILQLGWEDAEQSCLFENDT